MYDVRTYKQKAALKDLKARIIPSLAKEENDVEPPANQETAATGKKRRKRRKKNKETAVVVETNKETEKFKPQLPLPNSDKLGTAPSEKREKNADGLKAVFVEAPKTVGNADKEDKVTKRRRKRKSHREPVGESVTTNGEPKSKKQKTEEHEKFLKNLPSARVSDERLRAYGLNPKKFRQKEKYVLLAKRKEKKQATD